MRDATNDVQAQLKALRLNGMATAWADLTRIFHVCSQRPAQRGIAARI